MRRLGVLLLIAPALAVTAGCAGPTVAAQYVALGDSYTAAPGIATAVRDDGCGVSPTNYPHQVATALNLTLSDQSCSGAMTTAVTTSQTTLTHQQVGAQGQALTDEARLVTIGLGVNNYGLSSILLTICPQMALSHPKGRPCTDAAAKSGGALAKILHDVRRDLDQVLAYVAQKAPHARVAIVGYPAILPASGTCANLPIATGDYAFVRSALDQLNQVESSAAAAAHVTYVDVFSATRGHDICAKDPWIAGARAIKAGAPWHPYAEEQNAVARAVEAAYRAG